MASAIKQHILLVDDEPQVLVALEDLLSDKFTVSTASSGSRALELVERASDIAVVVTDQRMPRMTGDELLAQMTGHSQALRILVTGYADLTSVIRAVNSGQLYAYVTKPWNPEDLRDKISKAAEQFKLTQELAAEQEALAVSELRYRRQSRLLNAVLDGMGDGVVATDVTGKILICNRQAQRILGTEALEVPLDRWAGVSGVYELDQKTPLRNEHNPLFLAIQGRPSQETEVYVRNEAVSGANVAMTATVLRYDDNVLAGGIALLRDVTERKQLERQLLQSQKMEAIGQLAGGVAHDFNNLLAVIHSYGEIILDSLPANEGQTDEGLRDDMSELLGAAQRAEALTKQLLAFSRQQPMKTVVLDLNQLAINIGKMLRRLIGARIELAFDLSPDSGPVLGDPSQFEQIILNLAINARDAMPKGGRLTIGSSKVRLTDLHELGADDAASAFFVVLTVTDNGTGMDAEVQKRIFEPFFTTKDIGRGTGLGLSTVYGIVRQSGGRIEVESELGRGTTFKIYLPAYEGDSSAADNGSTPPLAFGNETILLIEEEEALRRVTARILEQRGYTVLVAADAADARRLYGRHAPTLDLVLADLALSEGAAPDFLNELRAGHPHVAVLYMSGHPRPVERAGGFRPPDGSFLEKPFTPTSLATAVRRALTQAGLEPRDVP